MAQFELEEMTQVIVSNVNIRSELHGTEHVTAIDVDFKLTASNDILSSFHGSLKSMLYGPAERGDGGQPELEGVPQVSDLTRLLCPYLEPITLKREYAGYTLTIDYGLGGGSNIEIGDCEVSKFKIDPKEGGSVELKFRVQASGVSEATLGKVGSLIGHEVEITLLAPEERQTPIAGDGERGEAWPFPKGEQAVIDGTQAGFEKDHPPAGDDKPAKGGKRGKKPAAEPDATEAFVKAHGQPEEAES